MGSVGTAVAQDGTPVSGTWANTVPLTITSLTPDGSDYDVVGTQGTDWHGSLEGSTTYTATFLFDPVANTSVGTIDETFTGTLAGVGPGTLHLAEQFTQDGQGLVTVDATIVGGTAALATVTGSLHFSGTADMNGIGSGTFSGSLRLPAPAVVPGAVSGPEGDAGTTSLAVPVTLSHASSQPVTVQYTTVHLAGDRPTQADPDTDYTPTTGTVTFAPGQTTATAPIAIHGDTLVEPDDYIIVSFHDATNATIGGFYGLGVATITNDD
jgi:hypothetical protein